VGLGESGDLTWRFEREMIDVVLAIRFEAARGAT